MYETFDHTADLGLRIKAPELPKLFEEAGRALFSCIVEDLASVEHRNEMSFSLDEPDLEYLFFDWLNKLLMAFDTDHFLFSRFQVELNGTSLRASVWGEPVDEDRHVLLHEVKAITYHDLTVEKKSDGWMAEVIVDI